MVSVMELSMKLSGDLGLDSEVYLFRRAVDNSNGMRS
jgi:hypothetical protein